VTTIDFHCEHCGKVISAPVNASGRRGKCLNCGGTVYIPQQEAEDTGDTGELPLVPLDPEEERQRNKGAQEAMKIQQELLHEQTAPGEMKKPDRSGLRIGADKGRANRVSPKDLNRMLVEYVEAMAAGRLDKAGELISRMSKHKSQTMAVLEEMMTEDLAGYGLPALPRPVLLGFLNQLRKKL